MKYILIISTLLISLQFTSCKSDGANTEKSVTSAEKSANVKVKRQELKSLDLKSIERTKGKGQKLTLDQNKLAQKRDLSAKSNEVATTDVASGDGLKWYGIDDLDALKKKGDKKVMIDMYTSWCGWCKVMDKKTFSDPGVIDYLNENFYVIKFNAEQKEPVTYNGKSYEWVSAGRKGVNTLAQEMMNGRLGYPTMVYLDKDHSKLKVSPGYKDPAKLMAELKTL